MSEYIGVDPAPSGLILVGDSNPVGMVGWFHGVPNSTWLQLNGQAVTKTSYPDLWAYAQSFLTADQVANPGLYKDSGGSTFFVPNFSGLFLRAQGGSAPNASAALGVLQGFATAKPTAIPTTLNRAVVDGSGGTYNLSTTAGSGDSSGLWDLETRPVNIALVPCVKALKTTLLPAGSIPSTFTSLTASLGADVALNNVANYFDGPSVAQGTAGTWYVSGSVVCGSSTASSAFLVKLHDGVTIISAGRQDMGVSGSYVTISLSGVLSSPAGNLRMSVKDISGTDGAMKWNVNGNAKDCTITAMRIG